MTDLVFFGLALAAFVVAVVCLVRAVRDRRTPTFGPVYHFASTSELLYLSAPEVRDDVLREALLDRAAQMVAHGD